MGERMSEETAWKAGVPFCYQDDKPVTWDRNKIKESEGSHLYVSDEKIYNYEGQ